MSDDCKSCEQWGCDHYIYVIPDHSIIQPPYVPNPKYEHIQRCAVCKYEQHDPCWSCIHEAGLHEEEDEMACCEDHKSESEQK